MVAHKGLLVEMWVAQVAG